MNQAKIDEILELLSDYEIIHIAYEGKYKDEKKEIRQQIASSLGLHKHKDHIMSLLDEMIAIGRLNEENEDKGNALFAEIDKLLRGEDGT